LALGGWQGVETGAQHAVHELLERHGPPPQLPLEPGAHVVIQRQRRSHALMLTV
jgi:hypothetical protein